MTEGVDRLTVLCSRCQGPVQPGTPACVRCGTPVPAYQGYAPGGPPPGQERTAEQIYGIQVETYSSLDIKRPPPPTLAAPPRQSRKARLTKAVVVLVVILVVLGMYVFLIHPRIVSLAEEVSVPTASDLTFQFTSGLGAKVRSITVRVTNDIPVTVGLYTAKDHNAEGGPRSPIAAASTVKSFNYTAPLPDGDYVLSFHGHTTSDRSDLTINVARTMF